MNTRPMIDAAPTLISPMCAALYPPGGPVWIPNAFCPIEVGPDGDAPAAAGVAAPEYPEPNDPCPLRPMFSSTSHLRSDFREPLHKLPGRDDLPDDCVQRRRPRRLRPPRVPRHLQLRPRVRVQEDLAGVEE